MTEKRKFRFYTGQFINDVRKYFGYSVRAAKAELKAEVMGSYLNWLWWIINPLCFMLIYSFVYGIIFQAKEQYFPLFIFIGLTFWEFFNHTVTASVKMVKANKAIISKVYLPKFVLIITSMMVNGFKMLISLVIVAIMMVIYKVPITPAVLFIIPILGLLVINTFAISTLVMHFGVYVQDLPNAVPIVLKMLFYFTGVFYDVMKRVPEPFNKIVLCVNPLAIFATQARNCLLNGTISLVPHALIVSAVSVVLAIVGIRLIYTHENGYVKVI